LIFLILYFSKVPIKISFRSICIDNKNSKFSYSFEKPSKFFLIKYIIVVIVNFISSMFIKIDSRMFPK